MASKKKTNGAKPAADTAAKKAPAKRAVAETKPKTEIEAKAPAKATSKAAGQAKQDVPHDLVARRAYQLFVSRGGAHGHALEDWLTAEAEVASEQQG